LIEHDETATSATASRAARLLLAAVTGLLLLMNGFAVEQQLGRRLDHDEAEYLHAAWLMDHGKRIYRDFMEDHPPFLFQILRHLDAGTVYDWSVRARVFAAFCGTLAMIAAAMVVWRISRNGPAAALTLAALLGAHLTWLRGLADIRADAPTLALFLTGLFLLIWEDVPSWRMAWLSGCGIALALAGDLWNPKWPLVGLCLGAFFLVQAVRLVRARLVYALALVLPAAVTVSVLYAALVSVTTLNDYLFFNFLLKSRNMEAFASQAWVVASFGDQSPLHFAPPRFAGPLAAVLYVLAILLTAREWGRMGRDRAWRTALILVAIAAAALEVRLLHPWPYLWPQFFLLFSVLLAIAYGLLGASLVRVSAELRPAGRGRLVAFGAMTSAAALVIAIGIAALASGEASLLTATAHVIAGAIVMTSIVVTIAKRAEMSGTTMWNLTLLAVALALALPHLSERMDIEIVDKYAVSWPQRNQMLSNLRPGDTVFVGASRHPVAAHDAFYFSYSFADLVPTTLSLIATQPDVRSYLPHLTADSLPVCQFARGRSGELRFMEISAYAEYLPGACGCAQVALSRPELVATQIAGVYEIVPPGTIVERLPDQGWDLFVRKRVAQCAARK
jgi:hypothetical protein